MSRELEREVSGLRQGEIASRLRCTSKNGSKVRPDSGTENREFSAPRTPFLQLLPQAAPRPQTIARVRTSLRVRRAASGLSANRKYAFVPCSPACLGACRRLAGAVRGSAERTAADNNRAAQAPRLRARHDERGDARLKARNRKLVQDGYGNERSCPRRPGSGPTTREPRRRGRKPGSPSNGRALRNAGGAS